MGGGPVSSVVVSKFAYYRYQALREFRNQNDTGLNKLPVSFDTEIRLALYIEIMRISGSGH